MMFPRSDNRDDVRGLTSQTYALTLIVPSFNSGKFLQDALLTLRSFPEVELIVQDSLSTDCTSSILEAEIEENPNIRVFSEKDTGQANALNRGLSRSSADFVGWLNADDLIYPEGLEAVLEAIRSTQVDVVYGDFSLVDDKGEPLRRYTSSTWSRERFFDKGCYIFSGATFWRTSFLKELGFREDLRYVMDLDLYLRAGAPRSEYVPRQIAALRLHDASKTGSEAMSFADEALRIRQAFAGNDRRLRRRAIWVHLKSKVIILLQPIRSSRLYSRFRMEKVL